MNQSLLEAMRKVQLHSHLSAFYDGPEERLEILAAHYKVGLENNEFCVFVTKQPPKQLIAELKQYGLDITKAVKAGQFQILPMEGAYLPKGSFKALQMLTNLRDFVDNGINEGYPAIRAGGDMDWVAKNAPGTEEVVVYEAKINRFIRSNQFTGICFLPVELFKNERIQMMLETHPLIIKNRQVMENPFYNPPEKSFKFDINVVSRMETWLDRLDENDQMTQTA